MKEKIIECCKFITSSKGLLIIGVLVFLTYVFFAQSNFISGRRIIKSYLSIFKKEKKQIAFFLGLPLLFAMAAIEYTALSASIADSLIVVLSILVTSLLAMLSVLVGLGRGNEKYQKVKKETVSVILLEIMFGMLSLLLTFLVIVSNNTMEEWLLRIVSFIIYYCVFAVLLNTLVIVKRIQSLIDNSEK